MNAPLDWLRRALAIEAFDDIGFDRALVDDMERAAGRSEFTGSAIRFHVPGFKRYASSELAETSTPRWPAVSVTGGECRLQCDHCKAKILEPMIPARTPAELWRVFCEQFAAGAQGMLITGGSNLRDEVEYDPFYPTIGRIKAMHPGFRIAMHTALVTANGARCMEQAGVDVAMLDLIGAQDTVTQVYHLKRPVSDFEESLGTLTRTSMRVVPHIVIGLHYGRLLGEWNALDMIARNRPHALVLVVVMPFYAPVARPFETPDAEAVGRFMLDARRALPKLPVMLGCARPAGRTKVRIDAYAVMAGLSAIAHPAEGVVELALRLGRDARVYASCCSMSASADLLGGQSAEPSLRVGLAELQAQARVGKGARALESIPIVAR